MKARKLGAALALAAAMFGMSQGSAQAQTHVNLELFTGVLVMDAKVMVSNSNVNYTISDQGGEGIIIPGIRAQVQNTSMFGVPGFVLGAGAEFWWNNLESIIRTQGIDSRIQGSYAGGLYGIIGWAPGDQRSMIYGRFGIRYSNWHRYEDGIGRGFNQTTATFGVGADIPIGQSLFTRIVADYAMGDDIAQYNVTLGIGYRF